MKTTTRLWIAIPIGLLLTLGVLGGVKAAQINTMIKAGASFAPPPEAVTSAEVQEAEWVASRQAVATLVAVRGVTLGAELPGLIREITFDSGVAVKKGAVLVRLDTSAEEAQLESAQADAALAKVSLDRTRSLRKGESTSQADLDAAEARAKQASAAVANLRAIIAKKSIRAPFDGRVCDPAGRARPGAVRRERRSPRSSRSRPIYADFWLPQQALADREGRPAGRAADRYLSRRVLGRHESPPSTPRWTRPPAT